MPLLLKMLLTEDFGDRTRELGRHQYGAFREMAKLTLGMALWGSR